MNEPTNVVEALQALQAQLDPDSTVLIVEFDKPTRQHIIRFEYTYTEPPDVTDTQVMWRNGSVLRSLIGLD